MWKKLFENIKKESYLKGYKDKEEEERVFKRKLLEGRLVNQKVICRSNENDPLTIGVCTSIEEITQAKCPVPVVKDENTGKEFLIMGQIILYDDEILKILEKKIPVEQWNWIHKQKLSLN